MSRPSTQSSLFGEPDAAGTAGLVAVSVPKAALSKAQRTFNSLTEQIRALREQLAAWDAYSLRFGQRVAGELEPILTQVRAAQRRLVLRIDELLSRRGKGERLSRTHRAKLRCEIEGVIGELLSDGPDPELEDLHDKYSDMSREELGRMEMELAEAMMSDVFGAKAVDGHGASDLESLMQHVHEKVAAEDRAQERRREERAAARAAKGGRPTKAELAAERKAQAAREANQSVRDIYRKLAGALHPDREPDAAERERKTLLMQRANQAYERGDLLELLTLQIEIEQIDAEHLSSVPETRMRHFNEVLRDQKKALEVQVSDIAMPVLFELGLPPRLVEPRQADAALSARIAEAKTMCRQIDQDLRAFDDPRQLRALLDTLPDDDDEFGPDDAALLDLLLGDDPSPAGARRRKRRK